MKAYLINLKNTIRKPHRFLAVLLLALINPVTFRIFEISRTFLVMVPFTLLVWFMLRWQELSNIRVSSKPVEIALAVTVYTLNVLRTVASADRTPMYHGLPDIALIFLCVCIAFYGIRGLRNFILPTIYLGLLIVGYQLEYSLTEVTFLENTLATAVSSVMALITPTQVTGNLVALQTREGLQFLRVDANCTGIKGMIAYGSLAILMIIDVKASTKRKVLVTALGVVGTFCSNFVRLLAIFLAVYLLGIDTGMYVHAYLGYGVFVLWMLIYWELSLKYLARAKVG